jgi:CheY-like chemotaxis protein
MKPIEVLLAEDNAGDALLVATILQECPVPVHLHTVRDGMDALMLLADGALHPDLVIIDLNMTHVSGHRFMEQYHPANVPVVVFSSSENPADINLALKLGASEYIQKPGTLAAYTKAVLGMIQKWVGAVHTATP